MRMDDGSVIDVPQTSDATDLRQKVNNDGAL